MTRRSWLRGLSQAAHGDRYAPAPRSERDLQRFATLGHELMHCFDGNWHDRWGRMNPSTQSAAAGGSR